MGNLRPAGKPGEPVPCANCGHKFPEDPPYSVGCPTCHAKPGQRCIRPSGHSGPFVEFHAERDLKALEMGFYDHLSNGKPCGKQSTDVKYDMV